MSAFRLIHKPKSAREILEDVKKTLKLYGFDDDQIRAMIAKHSNTNAQIKVLQEALEKVNGWR